MRGSEAEFVTSLTCGQRLSQGAVWDITGVRTAPISTHLNILVVDIPGTWKPLFEFKLRRGVSVLSINVNMGLPNVRVCVCVCV